MMVEAIKVAGPPGTWVCNLGTWVIMRVISIAQVTHGEEGCQHWKPP